MKKRKMVKLTPSIPKKSTAEVSEVYALLDVMKAIKIKEAQLKKKRFPLKKD